MNADSTLEDEWENRKIVKQAINEYLKQNKGRPLFIFDAMEKEHSLDEIIKFFNLIAGVNEASVVYSYSGHFPKEYFILGSQPQSVAPSILNFTFFHSSSIFEVKKALLEYYTKDHVKYIVPRVGNHLKDIESVLSQESLLEQEQLVNRIVKDANEKIAKVC